MSPIGFASDLSGAAVGTIVLASAALGGLALRSALRGRATGSARAAGVVAAVLLALSSAWLGLRPERVRARRAVAVLATPGAESGAVARLGDSLGGVERFALDVHLPGATPLTDLAELARRRPDLDTVYAAGWGATRAEWDAAGDWRVLPRPAPLPDGLVALTAPASVALGERLTVRGSVRASGPTPIRLEGPAGTADSATIAAPGEHAFSLAAFPRDTGSWRYVLRVGAAAETLGTSVSAPRAPDVLVLEAAPSFETSYLVRWLGRRGARVARWTVVSRGRERTGYVNGPARAIRPLSSEGLTGVDLVVADASLLDRLPPAERAALSQAIAEGGAGLLLRPDDARAASLRGWIEAGGSSADARLAEVRWSGAQARTPVPVEPLALRRRDGVVLMTDAAGVPLAAARPAGRGRIAVSLVRAPSRWLLAGDSTAFAEYWAALIGAVAPGVAPAWRIPGRVVANAPAALVLAGRARDTVAVVRGPAAAESLPIAPLAGDSLRRVVTYRPREAGWHRIDAAGVAATFYVARARTGSALDASERLAATAERAARPAARLPTDGSGSQPPTSREPTGLLLPFLVWLAAGAYLWSRDATR